MRRASVIVAALAVDRVLGDPRRLHPVAGLGRVALELEERIWRPQRRRGLVYVGVLVAGPALATIAVHRRLGPGARAALDTAVLWIALGGHSLGREAHRLAALVDSGRIPEARVQVRTLVGRDPEGLGAEELCRAAVESVAENTADAVGGPLVWFALAGAPGAVAYRAVNTLDALVGYRTPRHERFGWAAARLDDALTWPAARLCAALTCLFSPLVAGDPRRTWRVLWRDGRRHPSPNAGLLEAAFAGALELRLGGRNVYAGDVEDRPSLGDGTLPSPSSVRAAVRLSNAVGLGVGAACSLLVGRRS